MEKFEELKSFIEEFRALAKEGVKTEGLSEAESALVQEGFRQGLCAAAITIADELDAELFFEFEETGQTIEEREISFLAEEEQWWLTNYGLEE